MRRLTWAFTLAVLVISYVGLNYSLTNGILQVSSDEIFLSNYDDLDKVKTWDQLRTDHPSLDPSRAPGSGMQYPTKPATLTAEPLDKWEEFKYPKTIVALHLRITVESSPMNLRAPALLILVLDESDRIRGKLYTAAPSPEPSETQQSYAVRFWFRLPSDMVERQYRVVAELFGKMEDKSASQSAYSGMMETGAWFELDRVYGTLPAWSYPSNYAIGASVYTLLAYQRDDSRVAPPSTFSFRNMVGDISIVSALIPSLLGAVFVFRKRLTSLLKQSPELASGLVYILLSLALFLAMIAASVVLR